MAKKKSQPIANVPPENKTMTIHMVKGEYPPFHQLGEYTFQDLSAELFAEEPGIIASRVYGDRGHQQDGVDIIAETENDETEVGQCKRYQTFSRQNIIDASDDFFAYWENHWKSKNVRRFILFVACRITKPQAIDEIDRQKARFNQYGIQYELWAAEKLEQKLRPHFRIVSKFCEPSDYWVTRICGESHAGIPSRSPVQNRAEISINLIFASQLAEFASQSAEKELEEIRSLWQQGNEKEALIRIRNIRNDIKTWANASPEHKARIVGFEASIAFETNEDTTTVERLLDEAGSHAQLVTEKRIRALLLARNGKIDDALDFITTEDDVETENLRAALLLDAGRYDAAVNLLSELVKNAKATAETYRLMALSALVQGNVDKAEEYIKQARAKEPNWFRIHIVEGMIAYYQALSPVAVPNRLVAFPLPIDWMLIKQSKESIASLRRAEKIFAQVSSNTHRIGKEPYISAWRLACLFNDTERQEEAVSLCTSLLSADPTYFPAIAWATFRRLNIDLGPSVELLEKQVSDPNVSINNLLALLSLYDHTERYADGLHLLATTRARFEWEGALEVWTINYIRMLIGNNDHDEIEELATSLPDNDEYLPAWSLIASNRAVQSGKWNEFFLDQLGLFQKTQQPEFLLDACMALYRDKRWDEFAQYAEALIDKIGTADIYRQVILGVYNARQYEHCLALIERWEATYHNEQMQQEFRQMQVSCFYALGNYEKALSEATKLVNDNPSITNKLNLIHLLYEVGNYDAVAVHAASLNDGDLHPETRLRLASLLRGNHTSLAQKFWRNAMVNELPNEYVGLALDLAFKLGLEDEVGDLFQRLLSYDKQEKQVIQQFQTRHEIEQTFDSLRQKNAQLENAYRTGTLPIHFYAEELNLTFSDLFHTELKEKEENDISWSRPLYIRFGGRPLVNGFPQPIVNLRLFVDTSAILLSAHLGVLDEVEEAFAPLYIPSEVFASLTAMVDRTYHHQPSVIEANKAIVRLVSRKKLKVINPPKTIENVEPQIADLNSDWIECFELAKARSGYFITFLPPTKLGEVYISEPVYLTTEILRYLINCRTLADTLRDKHVLTKTEYINALDGLGTLSEGYPNTQQPKQQAFLVCDDNVIDALTRTGLLEHACNVFDVYITQRRFEIAQGVTSWDADREGSRKWLQALQDRMRTGLQQRRYITLPARHYEDANEQTNPVSSALLSLIQHSETVEETDAVWIDDRFSNHFNRIGKAPLIGIIDVLKLLVGKQLLSPEAYYEHLLHLRAGNARFIPLQPDELLFHLKNALKEDAGSYRIDESRPLMIIRRSIAACIADRKDIQIPPVPEQITNQQGEIEFILSLHRVIQQTLHEIWLSIPYPTARLALADWLIVNLYLDYPSLILREKEQRPIDQPDYYRAAAQLTGFLSLAYFQLYNSIEGATLYQQYCEWVVSRIIGHRLHTESELLEATANVIKQTLVHSKTENMKDYPAPVVDIVIHQFIGSMPEILQSKIESDAKFLEQIGVAPTTIITVDHLHFARDVFWHAIATVVNGGEATIPTVNLNAMTHISRLENHDSLVVCLDNPQQDKRISLNNEEFHILVSSHEERENYLRRQRYTFDCSDNEFEQIVDELQVISDPTQRILKLLALWTDSAAVTYENLANDIQRRKPLNFSSLAEINFESIARYLRLVSGSETDLVLSGVTELIQELGIEHTFSRYSGLPCPLPRPLIDAVDAIPAFDREKLLKRWINSPRSIMSTIHLLRLMYRYYVDIPSLKETAELLAEELCGEAGQIEVEAFIMLLTWVHQQFLLRTDFTNLSTHRKIIVTWTHAHQLFSIMKAGNLTFTWIKETFTIESSRISVEVLLKDKAYRDDIAHPRFVTYERLTLTGLIYALNKDVSLLPQHLRERIIDLAFPSVQPEHRFPALFLWFNAAFLGNTSNSFLNGNLGEEFAPWVEGGRPEQFTAEALVQFTDQLVTGLQDNDASEQEKRFSWTLLHSAVQDIPLPAELAERLSQLFLVVDWVHLFTDQYKVWRVAFSLALLQYPSSKNESLRQYLLNALREITKICNEMELTSGAIDEAKRREIMGTLLEGAIRLAFDPNSDGVALETFANTVIQMSWHWKYLASESRLIIQAMCESLPLPLAQQLWSTLVTLRAL